MTITSDFDLIDLHASDILAVSEVHTESSASFGREITKLQANFRVALWDIAVGQNATNDLLRRVFIAIAEVRQHIENLRAQKVADIASKQAMLLPASERNLPENAEDTARINRQVRNITDDYDALIAQLTEKDQRLTRVLTDVVDRRDRFQVGIDRLKEGLSSIDRLDFYQAGYAYIGLRLDTYVAAIRSYAISGRNNETLAIANFNEAIQWYETPEGVAAGEGLVEYAKQVRESTPEPTFEDLGVTPPLTGIGVSYSSDGQGDETSGDSPVGAGPDGGPQTTQQYIASLEMRKSEITSEIAELEETNSTLAVELYVGAGTLSSEQQAFIERQIDLNSQNISDLRNELEYVQSDIEYSQANG